VRCRGSRNPRRHVCRHDPKRSRIPSTSESSAGAIALADFKTQQRGVDEALRSASVQLAASADGLCECRRRIGATLDDLDTRRRANTVARRQRVFHRFHIAAGEVTAVDYRDPYAPVLGGSSNDALVELIGLPFKPSDVRES
jgi:hypothetical protein